MYTVGFFFFCLIILLYDDLYGTRRFREHKKKKKNRNPAESTSGKVYMTTIHLGLSIFPSQYSNFTRRPTRRQFLHFFNETRIHSGFFLFVLNRLVKFLKTRIVLNLSPTRLVSFHARK